MVKFTQKYEPTSIDDVVFPTNEAKQIAVDMVNHTGFKHIIFEGIYGTGKSSLLHLIPKAAFSPDNPKVASAANQQNPVWAANWHVDCKALNGFDCSSVEIVRTTLRKIVERQPNTNMTFKFVTIDEFDGMSPKAQQALKGLLDDAEKLDTWFLFSTNNYFSLDEGVRERCTRVHMDDFESKLWLPRLHYILHKEGVAGISDELLLQLIDSCKGRFRRLLNTLQDLVNNAHKVNAGALPEIAPVTNAPAPSVNDPLVEPAEAEAEAEVETGAARTSVVHQTPEQTAQIKAKLEAKVKGLLG